MLGLFYNSPKAACSIHETGCMAAQALRYSTQFWLDYTDSAFPETIDFKKYDFVVFNWHHATTPHFTPGVLAQAAGPKFTLVTECLPNAPKPMTPDGFDGYLVLDPTVPESERIWAMPRPLFAYDPPPRVRGPEPVIGSFGFATYGKRFDLLVQTASETFSSCIVRLHIPAATYLTPTAHLQLASALQTSCPSNVQLEITHGFKTQAELVVWCAENDLNAFFYYRNMPGLSAVTDQAVSSQQPLLVTTDYTFRHIHPYMKPFPEVSMAEAARDGKAAVLQMYRDWHPTQFARKFERVLQHA